MANERRARRAIDESLFTSEPAEQVDLDSTMYRRALLRDDDEPTIAPSISYRPARAARSLPDNDSDDSLSGHRPSRAQRADDGDQDAAEAAGVSRHASRADTVQLVEPTLEEKQRSLAQPATIAQSLWPYSQPAGPRPHEIEQAVNATLRQMIDTSETPAVVEDAAWSKNSAVCVPSIPKVDHADADRDTDHDVEQDTDGDRSDPDDEYVTPVHRTPQTLVSGSTEHGRPSPGHIVARMVPGTVMILAMGLIVALGTWVLPVQDVSSDDSVSLVTSVSRICPATESGAFTVVVSDGEASVQTLDEQIVQLSPESDHATAVGGTWSSADSRSSWTQCRSALTDQYVQIPGGEGSILTILNPDATDALIDITLTGVDGQITGEGLREVSVPARASYSVDLSAYDTASSALGARVRASVGRVVAYAQVTKEDGVGAVNSTQLGTSAMITGIPADAEFVELLFSNPGTTRNVVAIDAITQAGRATLGTYDAYALDATRTTSLQINGELNNAATSLIITGRDLFAVSAVVIKGGDLSIIPAVMSDDETVGSGELLAALPTTGSLMIANPSEQEALVTINWGEGQAPASRTLSAGTLNVIDIPQGALKAHVRSNVPIQGAAVIESDGLSVIGLDEVLSADPTVSLTVDLGLR